MEIKKENTDFFQITYFNERKNMAAEETSGYHKTFMINNVFQLSHGIKNIYQRSCSSNIHTREKFFAVAFFEGLGLDIKEICSILGLHHTSLDFQKK